MLGNYVKTFCDNTTNANKYIFLVQKMKFLIGFVKKKIKNTSAKYQAIIMYEDGIAYLCHKEIKHTQENQTFIYKIHEESKYVYQAHIVTKSSFYIA